MKAKKLLFRVSGIIGIILFLSACKQNADKYTRGVGIYPGDPAETYSPLLKADKSTYRNIARFRPAYHSSSYDYNLTAQLITDGLIINEMPNYISLSTNKGEIPKNEREWLLDHNSVTEARMDGKEVWIQLDMNPNAFVKGITKISMNGSLEYNGKQSGGWQFVCSGSNDNKNWDELGKLKGDGLPGIERPDPFAAFLARANAARKGSAKQKSSNPFAFFFSPYGDDSTAPKPSFTFNFPKPAKQRVLDLEFKFQKPLSYRYYRVSFTAPCAEKWVFGDWDFYSNEARLNMAPSHFFKSAWMSAGTGQEWVYVDLGSSSTFDHVKLYWINKAIAGSIQVSEDALSWKDLATLPDQNKAIDDISLNQQAKGRFVRILMTKSASGDKYVLSEMEVYGKGGMLPEPKPNPQVSDNRLYLAGGNWKIQRSSEVTSGGDTISKAGFKNDDWIVATVPGTALVSYWNAGALPDPNYSDNQLMISESFFNSDFWYRNEFEVPANYKGSKMFLNFDGINWKAQVFVNGKNIGNIEGAFIRGKFDVTDLIKPGQKNAIAVLILKNDHIGVIKEETALSTDKNGGALGADNPTYHASIGWDWIPTIRGRNIGIWNDVFLDVSGAVTIENPFVFTKLNLPDTSLAEINFELTVHNYKNEAFKGILTGSYGPIKFEEQVSVGPSESRLIKLNSSTHPELHFKNPKLWWPKGYGEPYLYDVTLSMKSADGRISDKTSFKSGVREMTFREDNMILNIYVNGRRLIARGGNWGFPESNLNYRGREYDAAVAYHADMNFNMIRNWVGQTADDEFYEACDKYGVMVWQDFWLANPADGPNPDNPVMFLKNADDYIKRIRSHPSIGIYVGRNEGNPPDVIDTALRKMIKNLHPGLHYISNSAMGVVSGGGPYRALPVRDYFLLYGYNKLHSERGMPNVMTYESLKQTLQESELWPQNSQWGLHNYTLESAQSCASFNKMVETGFGPAKDAREFTELAQWINYSGYRGMFEGRSMFRQGLLLWMSHPSWPSMVWQTYDYFLEPTAAYFGCKKASEPIHIQWNPVFDEIEVVNNNARDKTGLTAKAELINMDGSVKWEKEASLSCKEDSTAKCFKLEFPKNLSEVHFIKLVLLERNAVISENFYWRGLKDGNYQALRNLPKVELNSSTYVKKSGDTWILRTTLNNTTKNPILMVRLKVIGKPGGERILPVFYSDNYVSLMPGEQKVITMKFKDMDTRGEKPAVVITGFNLK
jgi:Exo-beta-D-glucosaminidase Ig-fold domain/Glycosyl hydrolases family 2/F5/8 type C domain/Glycosyl hydrolases family 2, sugar binding domain